MFVVYLNGRSRGEYETLVDAEIASRRLLTSSVPTVPAFSAVIVVEYPICAVRSVIVDDADGISVLTK